MPLRRSLSPSRRVHCALAASGMCLKSTGVETRSCLSKPSLGPRYAQEDSPTVVALAASCRPPFPTAGHGSVYGSQNQREHLVP